MEGHAAMDMSLTGGSILSRLMSSRGSAAISHYLVMDWTAIWKDIVGGLLIAGSLAAWVPESFWRAFFFVDHPLLAKLWARSLGRSLPRSPSSARSGPARSGPVEPRRQFRRRRVVHLRRPHRAPDLEHSPEVLRTEDELKVVTGVDDRSRFCVSAGLVRRATSKAVCEVLTESLSRYGIHDEILTGNGKVFTGRY